MRAERRHMTDDAGSASQHDPLAEATSSIEELNANLRRLAAMLDGDTSGAMGGIGAEIAEIDRNLHEIERLLQRVHGN